MEEKNCGFYDTFLVDEFANIHGFVPIRLDLTEIPRLEYLGIDDIEPGRRQWLEDNGVKLGMDVPGGYIRIFVRCPKHGEFGYMIRNNQDPCDGTLRCDRCIRERMEQIDHDRRVRYTKYLADKKEAEEKEKKAARQHGGYKTT